MNDILNIGFYGHSSVCWFGTGSFIDNVKQQFNANIVNIGVPQGSEERILFDLKKTKQLDIAVIFHSFPKFVFLPNCSRDVSISTVPDRKAKYWWSENKQESISQLEFEEEFFSYGKIKEVFVTPEEYVNAMTHLKEYFYHPDLYTNRFYGTLMMIDNYLSNKKIKAYHVIHPKLLLQNTWLKINSGHVDYASALHPFSNTMPNNLSAEHNTLISNRIIDWVNKEYGW